MKSNGVLKEYHYQLYEIQQHVAQCSSYFYTETTVIIVIHFVV